MHVKSFIHNLLDSVIHVKRVNVLLEVVTAALEAKKLTLTTLGRTIKGAPKSGGSA